ncbi:MAG: hypothetical protein AAF901_08930 [Bacteroidota bacterium]
MGLGAVSGTQAHGINYDPSRGFYQPGQLSQGGLGVGLTAGHAAIGYTINFSDLFR